METIEDKRENQDLNFLEPKKYCPRCKISFNVSPFKTLWRPPDLEAELGVVMQCHSCRMIFSWK